MMAHVTEVRRATQMLEGLVAGVAADHELSDNEIGKLYDWLAHHENLLNRNPFKRLAQLLNDILADGVIEPDERELLLDWCNEFAGGFSEVIHDGGSAIRRLHGFLQGISIDDEINETEVRDLQDWLQDHEYIRDEWPFDDVWALVERIVEDGQVTDDEREELLEFCRQFTERGADAQNVASDDERRPPRAQTEAPTVVPLDELCQQHPNITFTEKSFCFTGKAAAGHRKVLTKMAADLGATILENVRHDLDYLVIGAFSNTKWQYATYGQKVDKAKQNQERGNPTLIVHETDFVAAARRETWIRRSGRG